MEFNVRDEVMNIGTITRGALKHLRQEKANDYHKILNID